MRHRQQIVCSYVHDRELLTFIAHPADTRTLINLMNELQDFDHVYTSPTYVDGELWIAREDIVDEQLKGIELYFLPGDDKRPLNYIRNTIM